MKLTDTNLGSALVVRKTAAEKTAFTKPSDTYSEHAKVVFLFDCSGSMSAHIARTTSGASFVDLFVWSPAVVAAIRARIVKAISDVNAIRVNDPMSLFSLPHETEELLKLKDSKMGSNGEFLFTADDAEMKLRIVRADLTDFLGVMPDVSKKAQPTPTRMDVVKKVARQEITRRFKKFPKSRVAVVAFADLPITLFDDGTEAQVGPQIEQLSANGIALTIPAKVNKKGEVVEEEVREHTGYGTNITKAIHRAIDICRAKPSAVGIHHFILVTDGDDYAASAAIVNWIPMLKASGVVLDYIHIGDCSVNEGIRKACEELGGEYVTCNTEDDLEAKFVQATGRLLLPSA